MERSWLWNGARLAARVTALYSRCGVAQAAGALAYFLILTLFPLLLCVNYFIGLFQVDLEQVLLSLHTFFPQEVLEVLREYLRYNAQERSGTVLTAALVTIVISASAGLRTLLNTLDRLYGQTAGGGLKRLFESMVLSLLLLVTIYLSVVILFTGDWFFRMLEGYLSWGPLAALSGVWLGLRYVLLFSSMLILVLLIYWMGCPREARGVQMLCSAFVTAGALAGGSAVFAWMIGLSARYSLVYGSLASLMVLMVWLYFCGHVLLLGATVSSVAFYRRKRRKHR